MDITTFGMIFMIGSVAASLLTEAIKKFYDNNGKTFSPNAGALVSAIVVGCCGTIISYILMDIPFTLKTIACLILMIFSIWVGAMVGYDKVRQLIDQIGPH